MSSQTWSLIVLSYNEEESIESVLLGALSFLESHDLPCFEIIAVDDGSVDNSARVIRDIAEKHRDIRLIQHDDNRGIGEALRTGYFASKFANVCMIPGDGQFDINELAPFLDIPDRTIISFCRQGRPGYSLFRKTLSLINRIVILVLIRQYLSDANWVKIYKGPALRKLSIHLRSSLIESEILAKLVRRGCRVVEVPSKYLPRFGGYSRAVSTINLYRVLREVTRLIKAVLADRARP
jgi:glycosyltransferase involved in cell wall biosynthesis